MLCNTGGAGSIRSDNTKIHVCFELFGIYNHEVVNKKQRIFPGILSIAQQKNWILEKYGYLNGQG